MIVRSQSNSRLTRLHHENTDFLDALLIILLVLAVLVSISEYVSDAAGKPCSSCIWESRREAVHGNGWAWVLNESETARELWMVKWDWLLTGYKVASHQAIFQWLWIPWAKVIQPTYKLNNQEVLNPLTHFLIGLEIELRCYVIDSEVGIP